MRTGFGVSSPEICFLVEAAILKIFAKILTRHMSTHMLMFTWFSNTLIIVLQLAIALCRSGWSQVSP